jgi:FkbM family methyltransferase
MNFKDIARKTTKAIPPLYRLVNQLRGWRVCGADYKLEHIQVGGSGGTHDYGAWVVPVNYMDSRQIVYSFGIGEDTSFDRDIIMRYGCTVHAFDPTPLAFQHVRIANLGPRFVFHEIGLAAKDGIVQMVEPIQGEDSFEKMGSTVKRPVHPFPVTSLNNIMKSLNHEHIDLLKMDIEGFEYEVIADMVLKGIFPGCILVEFHHFQQRNREATRDAIACLRSFGYRLFWVSELGAEFGFIRILHK